MKRYLIYQANNLLLDLDTKTNNLVLNLILDETYYNNILYIKLIKEKKTLLFASH